MLCAKFGWNWPSGSILKRNFFLITSMYFHYFVIISPWKRAVPFIWRNLNTLHPRILCAKFGWKRPSISGEEDENVKSFQQRQQQQQRRTMDKFWSEKLTWAFGSGELKSTGNIHANKKGTNLDIKTLNTSVILTFDIKYFKTLNLWHWNTLITLIFETLITSITMTFETLITSTALTFVSSSASISLARLSTSSCGSYSFGTVRCLWA